MDGYDVAACYLTLGSNILIENNYLEAGTAEGAGIFGDWDSQIFLGDNVTIRNNTCNGNDVAARGGGVFLRRDSSMVVGDNFAVKDNVLVSPSLQAQGAGIYLNGWGTRFACGDGLLVESNSATDADFAAGGGIYVEDDAGFSVGDDAIIRNNVNIAMSTTRGGGIHLEYGGSMVVGNNFAVTNNTVEAQDSAGGAGISVVYFSDFTSGDGLRADHNVVKESQASYSFGGGLYVEYYSTFQTGDDASFSHNLLGGGGLFTDGAGIEVYFESSFSAGNRLHIQNNTLARGSGTYGGGAGLYLAESARFQCLHELVVAGNRVDGPESKGGGICAYASQLEIGDDGAIFENICLGTDLSKGSAIYAASSSTITASDGFSIQGNVVNGGAGTVFLEESSTIQFGRYVSVYWVFDEACVSVA